MRNIIFEQKAFEQFTDWATEDGKMYGKIVGLMDDIFRNPFIGIGKSEPLKHDLKGCWSRHINDEYRLVYSVTETTIIILRCKLHYELSLMASISIGHRFIPLKLLPGRAQRLRCGVESIIDHEHIGQRSPRFYQYLASVGQRRGRSSI
jgi:toxin YoeB